MGFTRRKMHINHEVKWHVVDNLTTKLKKNEIWKRCPTKYKHHQATLSTDNDINFGNIKFNRMWKLKSLQSNCITFWMIDSYQ
jgi:phosphosulfolactate synthase (CoM biosynthesis protein A)